jgi:hypothetical protein
MSGRLTDQQRRDRELSEADIRAQVEEVAAILGYESMFVTPLRAAGGIWKTPTRGSLGKGWPDTTFIHRRTGRTIYVEFKAELGKVTPDQERVHGILRAAGLEVHVVRPSDFDRFVEILRQ